MGIKKISLSIVTALTMMALTTQAFAVGSGAYANQVPSARAISRGNAMVASVDDATAVTFNAAKLPDVPASNLSVGFTLQDIKTKFKSADGVTKAETDNDLAVTPNFHISSKFGLEKWGFGLGINVPEGLATKWKSDGPLRYIATESELVTYNINPSAGYKINDNLSVGAGIDYYLLSNVETKQKLPGDTPADPDAEMKLDGNGSHLGYDVGVAYNINKQHLFGISYRHGAAVNAKGNLKFTNLTGSAAAAVGGSSFQTSAQTKVIIPAQLMLGYAYKPVEKWVIEFDGEWDRWSKYQEQNVKFGDGSALVMEKNWRDVWSFALGTEYLLNAKWALRGGFSRFNTPVPESSFEAGLPDANVNALDLGVGYNILEDLSLDVGAQLFETEERSISNDVGSVLGGNGKYKSTGGYYGFNLRYTFGKKA